MSEMMICPAILFMAWSVFKNYHKNRELFDQDNVIYPRIEKDALSKFPVIYIQNSTRKYFPMKIESIPQYRFLSYALALLLKIDQSCFQAPG